MSTVHVVHDIPGRLRLRVPPGAPAETLDATVATLPGIRSCTWSPRTRSVLVLYDPEHTTRDAIVEHIAQTSSLDVPPAAQSAHAEETGPTLALGVRQLFGEMDQRVQRATRGVVGLGGLLPAALTAWALTEVVRGRAAPLAWSSALWYAHGLFRDYQVPSRD